MQKKRIALHWKILGGMALGILWAILSMIIGWQQFTLDWIKPWGDIFLRMLKMIAVPLVMVSLIQGVSSLKDISSLSRMGGRTIVLYLSTTVLSILIGLLLANLIQPGFAIPESLRNSLYESYAGNLSETTINAASTNKGPLYFLVDMVPENLFFAASDNKMMLKIIFFSVMFGAALVLIPMDKSSSVKSFFDGANAAILKMVDFIMIYAPVGVSALIAGVLTEMGGNNPSSVLGIIHGLALYSATVLIGLILLTGVVYPTMLMLFVPKYRSLLALKSFYLNILPVQLVAFSTSSSAAALPINMERCEENLKLKKETVSFVLPLGATLNMDGTSLYQAVAALFIAQAYGLNLGMGEQLMVVLTCVIASIGSAAVPSAGMVMLIIVLSSIGLDASGIALVMAPDRILDMFRTVANVTSDATIASIVDHQTTQKRAIH
jgi:proton glutamate symport protein